MPRGNPTVRTFAPETWGAVDAFIALYSGTYSLDKRATRTLGGVRRHFEKAVILTRLALKLRPNLDMDFNELETRSFTSAANGSEFSAIVEAAINELYSSLDCAAKTIRAIYGPLCRGFKESTSGLFDDPYKIAGLPEPLKAAFGEALWEKSLRNIRTELVHHSTGHCDVSAAGGPVRYLHLGIYVDGAPLELPDVFAWLDERVSEANLFLGKVFQFLLTTLIAKPVVQMCGMVAGRGLIREIDPTARPITFDSGICLAVEWIEDPELPTCPFITDCGAYRRTRPNMDPQAVLRSKKLPEPWGPEPQPMREDELPAGNFSGT